MTSFRISSFKQYKEDYKKSIEQPEQFWDEIASQFHWKKRWNQTLEWDFEKPSVKWFSGGKLNITENCLDRHLPEKKDDIALIWEPNDPAEQHFTYTYEVLHQKVCEFANVLKNNNVHKGDRVCIYLPMIPELMIAVLACARIGAIHSVVFAGFSSNALADRINDASASAVITSDGMNRGAKKIAVKEIVDEALKKSTSVTNVFVAKQTDHQVTMQSGRDLWWDDEVKKVDKYCEAEEMNAEDELFILYTSGSTGKPKGIVHTCGGYMVYAAYSFLNVFQYDAGDIYWCTADIGWVTGHSYIVYGPLLNGATTVMFEGVPTFPDAGRFWDIVDKYKINQFYTAPTAIRSLMACGDEFVKSHDLSSLKTIGTVGEPINDEAWQWYNTLVGRNQCPIVDTWWQTETGGIMLSALGKHSPNKPTYAGYPLPGVQPLLLDKEGNEIKEADKEGFLVIKFPWPSILRTTYGDHSRCKMTYFSQHKGYYFTGDGAKRDGDGLYRVIGRVDDVINVSGHRFGTAEIEDAIDTNAAVVESAVIGYPHPVKGQGIYAYVICDKLPENEEAKRREIEQTVIQQIGKIAKPEKIQFVTGLPKTRSGKIMRRILRKIAEHDTEQLGDVSTLLDPTIVDEIVRGAL